QDCRPQIIDAGARWLHDECCRLGDLQRAAVGMRRCVDDEKFVFLGARDRVSRALKALYADRWITAVLRPQLLPEEDRLLLRIQIGDFDLEARVRDDGAEGPGKRALAGAALLRDEADDDGLGHGYSSNSGALPDQVRSKVAKYAIPAS